MDAGTCQQFLWYEKRYSKSEKLKILIENALSSFAGWSFILAVIGVVALIASAICFLTESIVHDKKLRQLKESQARFEVERADNA